VCGAGGPPPPPTTHSGRREIASPLGYEARG
jgi:hypothetical protein